MLSKKHRQSLRGLSHQEKVKKLQKITRVPLQKLHTNIAESDLEEDDVCVPISLKASYQDGKENFQMLLQQPERQHLSKKKVYDQEQINRTIRTMTKQLYSLEKQKQQNGQRSPKKHARNVSSFSIEELSFDLQDSSKLQQSRTGMEEFYLINKPDESFSGYGDASFAEISKKLNEISNKVNNASNMTPAKKDNHMKQKQKPSYRQSQPIYFQQAPSNEHHRANRNLLDPQMGLDKKRQSSQSNLTKRFSRTKRNYDSKNQDQIEKKLKFNRCSQRNQLIANIANKQNTLHLYSSKEGLLTDRLSYQQIPTYETKHETALKKRKNVTKNFVNLYQNQIPSPNQDLLIRQFQPCVKLNIKIQTKVNIKDVLSNYEKISQNPLFKQVSSGYSKDIVSTQKGSHLVSQVFHQYKESIQLLKQLI